MRLFILKRPPFGNIFFASRRNKDLAGLHPRNSPQIQLLNLHSLLSLRTSPQTGVAIRFIYPMGTDRYVSLLRAMT